MERTAPLNVLDAVACRQRRCISPLVFVCRHGVIAIHVCRAVPKSLNDARDDRYVEPDVDSRSYGDRLCVENLGKRR